MWMGYTWRRVHPVSQEHIPEADVCTGLPKLDSNLAGEYKLTFKEKKKNYITRHFPICLYVLNLNLFRYYCRLLYEFPSGFSFDCYINLQRTE